MEIGLSTASLFSKVKTEAAFEILRKLDISVCEVFLSTLSEYKDEFIDQLVQAKGNIRVHSTHALTNQFEPELFNPQERTRKDCEEIFFQVAKADKKLGASYYTFHGPGKFKRLPYVHNYEKIGKRVQELYEMLYKATDGKTLLSYENVHWTYFNEPAYFQNLKQYTQAKTCLDIKQAYLSHYDVYDYIEAMGDRLVTLHLCDYDDNGKLAIPGKGTFDFVKLFKTLLDKGFDGAALIEVYANNYDTFDELRWSFDHLNECLYKAKKSIKLPGGKHNGYQKRSDTL